MTQLVIDRSITANNHEATLTHTHHQSYGNRWVVSRSGAHPMVFDSIGIARLAYEAEVSFKPRFTRSEVLTTARYLRRHSNSVVEIATLMAAGSAYVSDVATFIDHDQALNLGYCAATGLIRFRDPETVVRTGFGSEVLKYAIHRLLLSDYAVDLGLVQDTLNSWSFFRPTLVDMLPTPPGVTRKELVMVWEVKVLGATHPQVQQPGGDIQPDLFALLAEL